MRLNHFAVRTAEVLKDLQPRNRINIQSFIWVVGAYREDSANVSF